MFRQSGAGPAPLRRAERSAAEPGKAALSVGVRRPPCRGHALFIARRGSDAMIIMRRGVNNGSRDEGRRGRATEAGEGSGRRRESWTGDGGGCGGGGRMRTGERPKIAAGVAEGNRSRAGVRRKSERQVRRRGMILKGGGGRGRGTSSGLCRPLRERGLPQRHFPGRQEFSGRWKCSGGTFSGVQKVPGCVRAGGDFGKAGMGDYLFSGSSSVAFSSAAISSGVRLRRRSS